MKTIDIIEKEDGPKGMIYVTTPTKHKTLLEALYEEASVLIDESTDSPDFFDIIYTEEGGERLTITRDQLRKLGEEIIALSEKK